MQEKLGDDGFEHFQSLDTFRKASFILGSELREDKFCSLGRLGYTVIIPAYNRPSLRLHGGRGELRCLRGETDTSCSYGVCSFVNGFAHCSGCVVYCPILLWQPAGLLLLGRLSMKCV